MRSFGEMMSSSSSSSSGAVRCGAVRPAQVGWMDGWMDARVGVCPCGWVPGVMNFLQFDPFRKLISKINPYKNLSQKTSFQKD